MTKEDLIEELTEVFNNWSDDKLLEYCMSNDIDDTVHECVHYMDDVLDGVLDGMSIQEIIEDHDWSEVNWSDDYFHYDGDVISGDASKMLELCNLDAKTVAKELVDIVTPSIKDGTYLDYEALSDELLQEPFRKYYNDNHVKANAKFEKAWEMVSSLAERMNFKIEKGDINNKVLNVSFPTLHISGGLYFKDNVICLDAHGSVEVDIYSRQSWSYMETTGMAKDLIEFAMFFLAVNNNELKVEDANE